MQLATAVALMPLVIFAAYTAAVTHNAFQQYRQPPPQKKIAPSPWWIWTPITVNMTWLTRHASLAHLSHLIGSVVFLQAHERDQQTDKHTVTHTDRPGYSVCRNVMRPNNNTAIFSFLFNWLSF